SPLKPLPPAAANTLFGKPAETTAPAAANTLFGKPAETTATTSAPSSLFGTPAATTAATTAPAADTTTTSAPAANPLFGAATTASTTPATTAPVTGLGATSTLGGKATQPPPQSRLKNKSMEEIINRWTADLEKYKGEFLTQADEIKKWDTVLISNGDKLVNLLSETTEAEKTQARMDTVLQQLENEQEELGTALDYYESQIKDFFEAQFGSTDGMQPADQEREKTYSLAEKLNEILIGMEGDLGEMIKAINKAGATINKTSNADDPLSQIVKILNDHLSSLQWIDTHTTSVAEKIHDAQRKGNSAGASTMGTEDDYFPSASIRGTALR
ncbi:Similar to Nuclear pore glycoprotein p62; acc. no. Q63850, partial [Pyronema omphalodes CBS 100304]